MGGATRTVTYRFQPDFIAQIEEARALTPPDLLAAANARRRPRSAVADRIARLSLAPFDNNPDPNSLPHPHPFSQPITGRHSTHPGATVSAQSTSSAVETARLRLRGTSTGVLSQTSSTSTVSSTGSNMSRPGSSSRPTHIALPTSGFTGRSPNGSPRETPASPTSPRSSFLPSFMRTRSRAATLTARAASPSVEASNPFSANTVRGPNSRDTSTAPVARDGGGVVRSVSSPTGGNGLAAASHAPAAVEVPSAPTVITDGTAVKTSRIRLVPHLENSRSLAFDPVVRELMAIKVPHGVTPSAAAASVGQVGPAVNGKPPALILKIGRFTDKTPPANAAGSAAGVGSSNGVGSAPTLTIAGGGGDVCSGKVAFKSKVVSRAHAEIWCEGDGQFYIRDTSSSSGTFLNHIRLSSPNTDSRPTLIKDGDVLQLGVDYQGGHEDQFRCVKMRVELGREWQRAANEFNTNALQQLKALGGDIATPKGKSSDAPSTGKKAKASVTDCCICLFSVTVCQSLFIAPCSHVFHYKCIRPLLMQHHPGFSCPLCRTFANLEEDVETEDAWEIASRRVSVISRKPSNHSIKLPPQSDRAEVPAPAVPGQPSTEVQFGDGTASVDDLLAGNSGSSDEGMTNSARLQRQTTAVADSPGGSNGEIEMPEPVAEEEEEPPLDNRNPFLAPIAPGSAGRPIPNAAIDPFLAGTLSEAQTPMNDTFLSTLAPSVHQRLDLARQMDEVGRATEPVREEPEGRAERSDDEWMEVDRQQSAEPDSAQGENRHEVEMMYT